MEIAQEQRDQIIREVIEDITGKGYRDPVGRDASVHLVVTWLGGVEGERPTEASAQGGMTWPQHRGHGKHREALMASQSNMLDLTIGELQALVDHHGFEGRVYDDCLAATKRFKPPAEDLESYRRMAEHHRERGRQLKELLAQEEHDQTAYEKDGTLIIRRPEWMEECVSILAGYEMDEETDGVTKLSCGVVIRLLEDLYEEDDDELPDG